MSSAPSLALRRLGSPSQRDAATNARDERAPRSTFLAVWAILALSAFAHAQLSPTDALAAFQHEPDVVVELVAAEPLIQSPCAFAFDEGGRLFVAENRGYPAQAEPPIGTIALLEDTDADGRMDKRTVFADDLTFPNGVLPWKGGLFVTCAPDVLYLKDTDGDGRADERRVVLTGFDTKGSTQLRVNAPILGPDGWIWLASGLSGGRITNPAHPDQPALDLKADLRFHPDTGAFEPVDGRSQYGHSFDEFGRRFICMNRIQVQHVVLSAKVLRRNPHLAFSDTVQNCPELVPNPLLRGGGGAARIYPISRNVTTADSHAGTFSAACAVTIWKGGALPEPYRGAAFSCDPTGNLVHVDRLDPRGATFAAVPLLPGREFLASRDDWFRPVFLGSGPDGALYVADMYRKVIEHPDYLPEEIRKRTDFASGREMGRIWRIRNTAARRVDHAFSKQDISEIGKALPDPIAWRRDTAFRLLLEAPTEKAREILQGIRGLDHPLGTPLALRLQAAKNLLEEEFLTAALRSKHDVVRVTALAVLESDVVLRRVMAKKLHPFADDAPKYLGDLKKLSQDPAPEVRFQWILTFGDTLLNWLIPGNLSPEDCADRWFRAAALSFGADRATALLESAQQLGDPLRLQIIIEVETLHAARGSDRDIRDSLQTYSRSLNEFDGSAAFLSELARRQGTRLFQTDDELLAAEPPRTVLRDLLRDAASILVQQDALPERRMLAARLLGFAPPVVAREPLLFALRLANREDIRRAAIEALLNQPGSDGATDILAAYKDLPAATRASAVELMASRKHSAEILLAALEAGALPREMVPTMQRHAFTKHKGVAIRERAGKLFPSAPTGDRMKAYDAAKASLALEPRAANGRVLFKKLCASCHRLDREGYAVGPDLFDIRRQPKESILLHIVAPEHEIAPGFAAYVVEMKDGRAFSGIVVSETPGSLTLRMTFAIEERLVRSDIAKLEASPVSLMPAGLEQAMTPQELADLLAYLKGEAVSAGE